MRVAVLLALITLTDSAAAKDRPPPPDAGLSAARLLSVARETREQQSCAAAAPTYRVVAAMGEGQEAAQHELGECLLLMNGANATETALFRQEALLWLKRAAFAGNARAQRALAVHYGARSNPEGSPAEALKWSLVYNRNSDADLYGYKALPETFVPGLKQDVSPETLAAAESFAASFTPLKLAKFAPPPRSKKDQAQDGPPSGEAPPGRGKPPRQ